MNKIKLSKSNSIKSGFPHYDENLQKVGTTMIGKNGKLYIVKKINNKKRWVISDFYKEYKKSEKRLIKLMKKSIIKFNYKPYEKNKHFFDENDENNMYLPESEITYDNTKNISFISPYEFRRLCCLSGYYKYVINTGDDVLIKDKKIIKTSYFFKLNTDGKIWNDFDKECKVYKKQMNDFIKKNKMLLDDLSDKQKKYILKNYIL